MSKTSAEQTTGTGYVKRLIEVDLPIARISAHARREKSIRHGHISTLHIWWARRPLAACRAVILAALWPDPGAPDCPAGFLKAARAEMKTWAERHAKQASAASADRLMAVQKDARLLEDTSFLRQVLLDFIADFANWDNATDAAYLKTSRTLVQAAHEAMGGKPGSRPLVVDPFAGGGAIPLEALRVGADAFASDLNPVAVLLNKVVLEYIPKYGQRLADEVRKWGAWVKEEAEKELAEFYPKDPDGSTPIAYLWARTIKCEGPGCGAEVPMVRTLWLAKKGGASVALRLITDPATKAVSFEVLDRPGKVGAGTVRLGSVTCPICSYTNDVKRIRDQLAQRRGGADDLRLIAVIMNRLGQSGRTFRMPTKIDMHAVRLAGEALQKLQDSSTHTSLSLIPDEPTPNDGNGSLGGGYRTRKYGIVEFGDFFTKRQKITILTFLRCLDNVRQKLNGHEITEALISCLAIGINRQIDRLSSMTRWDTSRVTIANTFSRHSISMISDFAEANPFSGATGDWEGAIGWVAEVCEENSLLGSHSGKAENASAVSHPIHTDRAHLFVTDPPYYDSVPYSELSDFFYVWLKRSLIKEHPLLFQERLTPKSRECIVNLAANAEDGVKKDKAFFEKTIGEALSEGRRMTVPSGVAIVVFAHKSTSGWETILQAMVDAGWTITASWPIDTEMGNRLRAQNSAALASSVHIVCRPRENPDGSLRTDSVGEWREVLDELPERLHQWMPRLAKEGVVGADAIFACLGPALEIFSRYARVERSSGEPVTLREYLEVVWAAVSREALSTIFDAGDDQSFEPDARLTAMWLWTLSGAAKDAGDDEEEGEESDEDDDAPRAKKTAGFTLEFDAARKIATGLGVHLDKSESIVHVKGDSARLLGVAERASYLFSQGAPEAATTAVKRGAKKPKQMALPGLPTPAAAPEATEEDRPDSRLGDLSSPRASQTVLDRLHQAMLLFAAGRGEALKRHLQDDGLGQDPRARKLALALASLYPRGTDERRWIEGVSARIKSLGL